MTIRSKFLVTIFIFVSILGILYLTISDKDISSKLDTKKRSWEIKSIDTVKYSRDLAREKLKDTSFDQTIDDQVRLISGTGATHLAVGTPYDKEFLPFLKRWITAARKYNLKVWFRGNLSGWEGWFNYKKISRDEHTKMIQEFILTNGELFENGDVFSACTECENGGPGDPRKTDDVNNFRSFLIEEYKVTSKSFRRIGKNVRSNFMPMNGDVVKLVMNKETTKLLGGIVVIDHYVKDSKQLLKDINDISERSGGRVVLGEFGAPILDIHGNMNEVTQAEWVKKTLTMISKSESLIGVNYWTSFGGSTRLWENDGRPREAANVISDYFHKLDLTTL